MDMLFIKCTTKYDWDDYTQSYNNWMGRSYELIVAPSKPAKTSYALEGAYEVVEEYFTPDELPKVYAELSGSPDKIVYV